MPSFRRSVARAKAIRLDQSSLLEAGLAFFLAYLAAFLFSRL